MKPPGPQPPPPQLDHLSKRDFEALGCEDVSGAQLRARVFHLEATVAGLALALEELLADVERCSVRVMVIQGAREALETARARYGKQAGDAPATENS